MTDAADKNPLWVVCGTDENYAMPLSVTLYSFLSKIEGSVTVHLYIIEDNVSSQSKNRLTRVVQNIRPTTHLRWTTVPSQKLDGLRGHDRFTMAAYLRLLIPDLLPLEAHRAIYLDCDLLVVEDLQRLNQVDLQGAALGAVRDFAIATLTHPYSGVKNYSSLGLNSDDPYFNSGVLVINIDKWRRESIGQKIIDYILACGGTMGNPDQDALNAMLTYDWKQLSYSWNVQGALLYLHENAATEISQELKSQRRRLLSEARIIHFSGSTKPWQAGLNHPYAKQWRTCLFRSQWFAPIEAVAWFARFLKASLIYDIRRRRKRFPIREKWD